MHTSVDHDSAAVSIGHNQLQPIQPIAMPNARIPAHVMLRQYAHMSTCCPARCQRPTPATSLFPILCAAPRSAHRFPKMQSSDAFSLAVTSRRSHHLVLPPSCSQALLSVLLLSMSSSCPQSRSGTSYPIPSHPLLFSRRMWPSRSSASPRAAWRDVVTMRPPSCPAWR
jgi:hypothetical protein